MTSPATTVPTDQGQGGTGGGTQPPGSTADTEYVPGGTRTEPAPPPAVNVETSTINILGGIGRVGDTDSHAHDPVGGGSEDPRGNPVAGTIIDTTVNGGNIGATTDPAYRAPSDPPPAMDVDTSGRVGVLPVNPGSPDAPVVGDASGINPNGVDPGYVDESSSDGTVWGYPAPDSSYAVPGTTDTSYLGAPLATVPANTGTPHAPTGVSAAVITGRAALQVSWTAPDNAQATGVEGYQIENNKTGTMRVGKNALTAEFEQGLIPGDAYTFTVFALTANGNGPRSVASAPVTVPKSDPILADTEPDYGVQGPRQGLPGAPAAPVATVASTTSVSVAFSQPASTGNQPITQYTVTSTPGGVTASGSASPIVVPGLTHGTAYTFKVHAKNVYGNGPDSAASNSVTP